jgi:hypothetical protein
MIRDLTAPWEVPNAWLKSAIRVTVRGKLGLDLRLPVSETAVGFDNAGEVPVERT